MVLMTTVKCGATWRCRDDEEIGSWWFGRGFDHILGCTQLHGLLDLSGLPPGREDDHRNVLETGIGLDHLEHLEPVHYGHRQIEQHGRVAIPRLFELSYDQIIVLCARTPVDPQPSRRSARRRWTVR